MQLLNMSTETLSLNLWSWGSTQSSGAAWTIPSPASCRAGVPDSICVLTSPALSASWSQSSAFTKMGTRVESNRNFGERWVLGGIWFKKWGLCKQDSESCGYRFLSWGFTFSVLKHHACFAPWWVSASWGTLRFLRWKCGKLKIVFSCSITFGFPWRSWN